MFHRRTLSKGNKNNLHRTGFTIVELVVIIVVIGILASVVALGFTSIRNDATDSERATKASTLATALEDYFKKNGEYPQCAQLTGTVASVLVVLPGLDPSALKAPDAPSGTTNSIVCTDLTSVTATDVFSYTGGPTGWTLKYKQIGSNEIASISSSGKHATVTPPAPTVTTMVTTYAGSGTAGNTDGTGLAATFRAPYGMAIDSAGNFYVSDSNSIRKVTVSNAAVVTMAGTSTSSYLDGTGTAARFRLPTDLSIDASNNVIVADSGNGSTAYIRQVTQGGVVTTIAGGGSATVHSGNSGAAPLTANIINARGVAVAPNATILIAYRGTASGTEGYMTSLWRSTNRMSGIMGNFLNNPTAIAIDPSSTRAYVADTGNHRIVYISHTIAYDSNQNPVNFAGTSGSTGYVDATGATARFAGPRGVAVDSTGNVYVADTNNHRIRKITPAGVVTTVAGGTAGYADGDGATARFNTPSGIIVDGEDNLYVADTTNNRIRKVTFETQY